MAQQRLKQTLDERIAAALSPESTVNSADLQELYEETEAALSAARREAAELRGQSLDPTTKDAAGARAAAQDYSFRVERLAVALPRLVQKLDAARRREEHDRWLPQYQQVEAEGAALAEEVPKTYAECVIKLVSLFQRMAAHDQRVGQINHTAPAGEMRRLKPVEQVAGRLNSGAITNPALIDAVKLPIFEDCSKLAWPPPTVPFGVLYAESVAPMVARMGSPAHDLAGYHAAEDAARVFDAEYTANYYRRLNEQQRDRERTAHNAEREGRFAP
jgi:hypothetical protein